MKHWIVRVGGNDNFYNSSVSKLWGISSKNVHGKVNGNTSVFLRDAEEGDQLWFVPSGANWKVVATATLVRIEKRVQVVPGLDDDSDRGWEARERDVNDIDWDTDVRYKDLYDLSNRSKPLYTDATSNRFANRLPTEKDPVFEKVLSGIVDNLHTCSMMNRPDKSWFDMKEQRYNLRH